MRAGFTRPSEYASGPAATGAAAPHAGRAGLGVVAGGGEDALEQCEPGPPFRDAGSGHDGGVPGLRRGDWRQCVDWRRREGGAVGDVVYIAGADRDGLLPGVSAGDSTFGWA